MPYKIFLYMFSYLMLVSCKETSAKPTFEKSNNKVKKSHHVDSLKTNTYQIRIIPKIGTYRDKTNTLQIRILEVKDGKIIASHCFVTDNGNRIDFCENKSIVLDFKKKHNVYNGKFHSCYTDMEYNISVTFNKDRLTLTWQQDDYPLLEDTAIDFYYMREKDD